MKRRSVLQLLTAVLFGATNVYAQSLLPLGEATETYSPFVGVDYPDRVFFGDTHLHTAYSTDAGLVGATLGPDEAYRFAKGHAVTSSMGIPAQLKRPLDFLVIADHAENLGLPIALSEASPELLSNEWGQLMYDGYSKGTIQSMTAVYLNWMKKVGARDDPLAAQPELQQTMWQREIDAADAHYVPGVFTSFIGFEWTSMPNGKNLHRVVVLRDDKTRAGQVVPLSAYDTENPQELWDWLEAYETKTGGRVLAIPHNGNLSNGLMFDDVTFDKAPLTQAYAQRRMRWEPLYEMTQAKGDAETHPLLSPDDEFADFERWDTANFGPEPHTTDMLPREYARESLKRGLAYNLKLGANPFKFGMIGSTDQHTALSTAREDNFFGKVSALEPSASPMRFEEIIAGRPRPEPEQQKAWMTSAGGLTAVWARENTREAIWDAMARKEVYATTGTRIMVRLFAGWDFQSEDLARPDMDVYGYRNGVPMGNDLVAAPTGKVPGFLVEALKDVDGANLDRVQVVKGWLSSDGMTHERVWDVAVSDERKIDKSGRARQSVGNTVDPAEPSYRNTIGSPALSAFWQDPDFDPTQAAFYYVRVLEIPTPRWTTFDARHFDRPIPEGAPIAIQERAYTSPVWYTP